MNRHLPRRVRRIWSKLLAAPAQDASYNAATVRDLGLFRQIFDSLPDSVLAIGSDGTVVAINRSASELLGINDLSSTQQSAALGADYRTVLREDRLIDAASSALQNTPYSGEFDFVRPSQSPRVLKFEACPLPSGFGATIFIHDITEIRRLERMRQDFVSNVSHELRTPVSIVLAHVETLQDGTISLPEASHPFLNAIARSAERLSTLISDLLDLSRIESGNYDVRREQVDFATVCAAASDAVATVSRSRGSELEFDFPDGLTIFADRGALEQILVNLIENALKYGPSGNAISIEAQRHLGPTTFERGSVDGPYVRVNVCDRGPGISEKHRPRVFERFYRVDPGRSRAAGGTGLGLSIVRHLSEAMGGQVGVDPREGGGSIFWFCLPEASASSHRHESSPIS